MSAASITESLRHAARSLQDLSDSPRLDAELLLAQLLRVPRSTLLMRGDESLPAGSAHAYDELLEQRREGVPVAYLTGTREFWSLPLRVTRAVLVPRPETEVLVEQALEFVPRDTPCAVLDLGTGSGAIALAIASERPRARIVAVDLSDEALAVARENAGVLRFTHIDWRLGSWFDAVPRECFDVIVANPPYIAAADPALDALSAEPRLALTSGPTGLESLTAIAARAARHLNPSGRLILEHGSTQAAAVAALLARCGFTDIHTQEDLAGRPRVTLGSIHTHHWEKS